MKTKLIASFLALSFLSLGETPNFLPPLPQAPSYDNFFQFSAITGVASLEPVNTPQAFQVSDDDGLAMIVTMEKPGVVTINVKYGATWPFYISEEDHKKYKVKSVEIVPLP